MHPPGEDALTRIWLAKFVTASYSPCYSLVTRGVLPRHKWKLLLSVTESGRDLRLPLFSSPYLLLRHHITLSLSLTSSPFLFLSPSGDLRIGLVWDNLKIHPIQSHNSVWVLKSCSNWTKSSIPRSMPPPQTSLSLCISPSPSYLCLFSSSIIKSLSPNALVPIKTVLYTHFNFKYVWLPWELQ